MTNTNHSKLPPSSAARRMACPGSRAMEERYGRNDESEASQEGTLAHECAAHYLKNSTSPTFSENISIRWLQEMIDGAKDYAETVTRFITFDNLHVEERVNCDNIHPDMWGTPDAWGLSYSGDGITNLTVELHVFDYKFGHTPIDAFENWQLIAYACGIVKDHPEISGFYLHIIQPRDYISLSRHKVWHLNGREFQDYKQRLINSEYEAMSLHPVLKVSDQCKYCKARSACPALRNAAFGATETAYRDIPQGVEPKFVGNELKLVQDAQELLGYRIKALETEVQHLLQAGVNVDYYELKPIEGRMTWKIPASDVIDLGLLDGVNLAKEPDVITPAQAIKAGVKQETVLKYTDRKQSLKLSRTDVKNARAVFAKPKQTKQDN